MGSIKTHIIRFENSAAILSWKSDLKVFVHYMKLISQDSPVLYEIERLAALTNSYCIKNGLTLWSY